MNMPAGAPVRVQRLSTLRLIPHFLHDFVYTGLRLMLRRTPRLRPRVTEEYDAGTWKRVRDARRWEQEPSLERFLIGSDGRMRIARVDGSYVRIRTSDYHGYRIGALAQAMRTYADQDEELIELGCGYGYNLFSLALSGTWPRLAGFDISENGVAAGREIARHFGLEQRLRFGQLDLTDSGDANFQQIKGKTVFSYFCIEQLTYAIESTIKNILAQRPRRVVHFESASEMLRPWHPRDLLNKLYVHSMDYQAELISALQKLERERLITIVAQKRMAFAPTIHNDGFIIVWEPK